MADEKQKLARKDPARVPRARPPQGRRREGLLPFIWAYFKLNLSTAMEYRWNFIIQSVGMFVNDIVWVLLWIVFFGKFRVVNSWTINDMYMLYGVITIAYGVAGMLFGNFTSVAKIVRDGYLDFFLSLPKEELTHLLMSRSKYQAAGDFFFGVVIFILFLPLAKWPLAIILCIFSTLTLLGFAILLGSLSFYTGSAVEIARHAIESVVGLASYPLSIYSGFTKFVLLVILPAGFITGVPVELLKQFDLTWFLLCALFSVTLFTVAVVVFKRGVKRYESGNLINVRT